MGLLSVIQTLNNQISFGPSSWIGKTVTFIGDSITAGSVASPISNRWTTLLCSAKGATENNMGISGQVLQNGTVCGRSVFDQTTIPTRGANDLYLFIALGVNDIGTNNGTMTPGGYQTTLSSTVDYAVNAKGWNNNAIVIVNPYYVTAAGYALYVGACSVTTQADATRIQGYVTAADTIATQKNCILMDINTSMTNDPGRDSLIGPDGLHPNNAGHAYIFQYAASIF